MDNTKEGWALPTHSARKYHFIVDGKALCNCYMYWGDYFEADRDAARSPDDCKACRTKLEALIENSDE